MSVCVYSPMLNEIRFAKAWCENVTKFADEIIVVDTGCTDGTIEVLESYGVKILYSPVKKAYEWDQAKIRQLPSEHTKCEWIFYQDADQLIGKDFISAIPELQRRKLPAIRFKTIYFWGDLNHHRVRCFRSWNDWRHFYPNGGRNYLYRRETVRWVSYPKQEYGCGAHQSWRGFGRWSQRICSYSNLLMYHYHYAFALKDNDLSRGESAGKIAHFTGIHPEEIKYILRG